MRDPSEFFGRVDPLPTAPAILPKLLAALADPQVNLDDVVLLIAKDPVLAARLLKLCNRAYFARSSPTADISEAVSRIGF